MRGTEVDTGANLDSTVNSSCGIRPSILAADLTPSANNRFMF